MKDMTVLPNTANLYLVVIANGHAFGASAFHVLRLCTGIRRLMLLFGAPTGFEVKLSVFTRGKAILSLIFPLSTKK